MIRRVKIRGASRLLIDFRYTDPSGLRQRFRKLADVQMMTAARAEETRLRDLAARTGTPEGKPKRATLAAFHAGPWQSWRMRFKPSTRERYDSLWWQGIESSFGKLRLDEITPALVAEYAADISREGIRPHPHTLYLSTLLRAAVALGELDEMPKLPSPQKPKTKLLTCPTADEVRTMISTAKGWLKLAIALAAYAGLRSGEVRALEARDIDWRRGVLLVRRAYSAAEVTCTKSGEEREVPISPDLEPLLRGAPKAGKLVLTPDGDTPRRQHVLTRLQQLQDRFGLPRCSFHALRHHFCTHLLSRGAHVEVVRVVAGHSDIKTTARYLHAQLDDARLAMGLPVGNQSGAPLN